MTALDGLQGLTKRALVLAWLAAGAAPFTSQPAEAQGDRRAPQPLSAPPSEWIDCPPVAQPLIRIPEIVSRNGLLRGTVVLQDDQMKRIPFKQGDGTNRCAPQRVRNFVGLNAVLPDYPGEPPAGYGGVPPIPADRTADPVPGPTLRARVGDIVQLTLLNHVNPNNYGDSIDRGERGQGCDESNAALSGSRRLPRLLPRIEHRRTFISTARTRIRARTGDNVFLEVRPSLREADQPIVTEESVKTAFEDFFSICGAELKNNVLSQFPTSWNDLPLPWRSRQEALLKAL